MLPKRNPEFKRRQYYRFSRQPESFRKFKESTAAGAAVLFGKRLQF